MIEKSCATCKYKKVLGYSRYRGCNLYECHRFPPCAKREGSDVYSFFPVTNEDHWCWEWKPKEVFFYKVDDTDKRIKEPFRVIVVD